MAFEPIPVESYQWVANEDPLEAGLRSAAQSEGLVNNLFKMHQQKLADEAQKTRDSFLKPLLAQKLKDAQIGTQESQEKLKLYPELEAASLKSLLAHSLLAHTQAQTMPQKLQLAQKKYNLAKQQAAMSAKRLPLRTTYAFMRMMENPGSQSLVEQNPRIAREFGNIVVGLTNRFAHMLLNNPNGLEDLSDSSTLPGPVSSPTDKATLARSKTTFPKISPTVLKNMQSAVGSDLMRKTQDEKIREQRVYSNSAFNMLNAVKPHMAQIAKFASAFGKGRSFFDHMLAQGQITKDPGFVAYKNFTTVQAPLIANDIRRAMGGQATDKEAEMMKNLANPTFWNTNPQLALDQFQSLVNTLHQFDKALDLNLQQSKAQLTKDIKNPIVVPGATTRVAGMGERPVPKIKIPTFKNEAEKKNWILSLTPAQYTQLRAQLQAEQGQ
ncbi:MAG: hypothetical protein ACPGVV_01925 [Croceimicrobium sp.]